MRPLAEAELGSWGTHTLFSPKSCGEAGDTKGAGTHMGRPSWNPQGQQRRRQRPALSTAGEGSCFLHFHARRPRGSSCRGGVRLSPRGWLAPWASEQGKHGARPGKVMRAARTHSPTPWPPDKCCSGHHPSGPRSSPWPRGRGGGGPCPRRVLADRPGAFVLPQEPPARGGALAREVFHQNAESLDSTSVAQPWGALLGIWTRAPPSPRHPLCPFYK